MFKSFTRKVKVADQHLSRNRNISCFEMEMFDDDILTKNINIHGLKCFLKSYSRIMHRIICSYISNDKKDISVIITRQLGTKQQVISKFGARQRFSFECNWEESICQYNKCKFLCIENITKNKIVNPKLNFVKTKQIFTYFGSYNSKFDFSLCVISHKKLKLYRNTSFSILEEEFKNISYEFDKVLSNMDLVMHNKKEIDRKSVV